MEVDSRNMVAAVKIHTGQPHEAVPLAREAYEIAGEIDNAWGRVNTGFNLAQALFECGQWGEAWTVINRAVATAEKHTLPLLLGIVLGTRGIFYNALLAPERARVDHERMQAVCEQLPTPHFSNIAALDLCSDCIVAGDWAGAHRYAREALRTKALLTMFYAFRYWRLVEALLHDGDISRARDVAEDFGERIGDHPRYTISYRRALALLSQEEEHLQSAAAHLEVAVDAATEIGLPGELWQLYAALGDLFANVGDDKQAAAVRAEAEEIVKQLAGTLQDQNLRSHFLTAARQMYS